MVFFFVRWIFPDTLSTRKEFGMKIALTQVAFPESMVLSNKVWAQDSERPRKRRRTK
jgi:hypothetical protein